MIIITSFVWHLSYKKYSSKFGTQIYSDAEFIAHISGCTDNPFPPW